MLGSFRILPTDHLINIRIRYCTWYLNIRILQTMVSGIPFVVGLGTKMEDPYVSVVFGAPSMGLYANAAMPFLVQTPSFLDCTGKTSTFKRSFGYLWAFVVRTFWGTGSRFHRVTTNLHSVPLYSKSSSEL